jgi:kinesin family protein 5
MEGPSLWDTQAQGVIPRTIDKIFALIQDADESNSFTVAVSYYEVYNEKIRDLLNPSQDDLKMREYPNKADGWFIQDITEAFCADRDSVIRLIETGKTFRATAATLMNADSSRSHSILSILISQKNEVTGRNRKGRLFLVDLAGSEKISKTGATGQTKKEAIGINISLTTLGMVINALCDGSSHIPYRDSKLTLILKNSLGGNSKTTLIICCASEARHTLETISTLRFGERAKRIKNNARVNEELGVAELKKMLQIAQREIAELKASLASTSSLGAPSSGGVATPLAVSYDSEDARSKAPKDEGTEEIAVTLRYRLVVSFQS